MSTHNIEYKTISKFKTCLNKVAALARYKVRQKICPNIKLKIKNAEVVNGKKRRRRDLDDIGFEESINVRSPCNDREDTNLLKNHESCEKDSAMKVMERATSFFAKEKYCDFTQFKEVSDILYYCDNHDNFLYTNYFFTLFPIDNWV